MKACGLCDLLISVLGGYLLIKSFKVKKQKGRKKVTSVNSRHSQRQKLQKQLYNVTKTEDWVSYSRCGDEVEVKVPSRNLYNLLWWLRMSLEPLPMPWLPVLAFWEGRWGFWTELLGTLLFSASLESPRGLDSICPLRVSLAHIEFSNSWVP